jgi:hypothetical protein
MQKECCDCNDCGACGCCRELENPGHWGNPPVECVQERSFKRTAEWLVTRFAEKHLDDVYARRRDPVPPACGRAQWGLAQCPRLHPTHRTDTVATWHCQTTVTCSSSVSFSLTSHTPDDPGHVVCIRSADARASRLRRWPDLKPVLPSGLPVRREFNDRAAVADP